MDERGCYRGAIGVKPYLGAPAAHVHLGPVQCVLDLERQPVEIVEEILLCVALCMIRGASIEPVEPSSADRGPALAAGAAACLQPYQVRGPVFIESPRFFYAPPVQ
jgi:hypothetical protein